MTEKIHIDRTCDVVGCNNPHTAKGYCGKHYMKMRRSGSIDATQKMYKTPEEAFEARTVPVTETGCLLWLGAVDRKGYGVIKVNGKNTAVHRYAWEREHGPIPDGMLVDHKDHCDVSCCNPNHLRLATNQQNTQNRSGVGPTNTSGYRGVSWNESVKKWFVQITENGKYLYRGYFDDVHEAGRVARERRKEFYGEFAGKG